MYGDEHNAAADQHSVVVQRQKTFDFLCMITCISSIFFCVIVSPMIHFLGLRCDFSGFMDQHEAKPFEIKNMVFFLLQAALLFFIWVAHYISMLVRVKVCEFNSRYNPLRSDMRESIFRYLYFLNQNHYINCGNITVEDADAFMLDIETSLLSILGTSVTGYFGCSLLLLDHQLPEEHYVLPGVTWLMYCFVYLALLSISLSMETYKHGFRIPADEFANMHLLGS